MSHIYSKEISIKTIDNAKELTRIASKYEEDIDLIRGRYVVDAKSIMGIFTLDLIRPATLLIHTDDVEKANSLFKELDKVGVR